ncbi:serine/threonine-protein kinase [Actinomadura sp. HBU206391]|uniref:serine/threonine-protein kinase n=1 Tax=Actinomadura sp. HBU206391 TaxID=2731692 RepID=UPI0021C9DA5F|nr:serine/threonine protein kinase [Actinomadura sp. HBU206391]
MPNESTGDTGSTDPVETRADQSRLLARRYRLGKPVGRGGMGTVWQAHDEVLGRDVAVKEVILPHGLSDDERTIQYKRTFREARTAARLGHPGVVTVYDVVEEDGRPWIIMELIQSQSLDQVIKREGPLAPRRAAEIGRQMLAALHAAHEAGVLHRDVKPSNVLLGAGDRAVLTDFGIATATGDVTLTQTGLVMGSPAYIAPERARGRTVGPASDLWSLGITLYAMVDGKSPYERSEPMASLVAIISEEPEPSANAGPLAPVIEGLLRKNPDERMDAREAGMLLDELVRARSPAVDKTRPIQMPREEPPAAAARELADTSSEPPAARTVSDGDPDAAISWATGADDTEQGAGAGVASASTMAADPSAPAPPRRPRIPQVRVTTTSVILVIVGIALLALGIVAIQALNSGDNAGRRSNESPAPAVPPKSPSTKARAAAQKPSPSASGAPKATTSGVPEGFKLHNDPSGFSVAIPKDWSGPERRSYSRTSVFFSAPDRDAYLQIDQTDKPGKSALADWQGQARGAPGRYPGYKEIKIAAVADGAPVSDPSGKKAADWEFTHGSMHVLNRGFVTNGHGYAILLSAPSRGWNETFERLAPVYESFESG